MSDTEAIRYRLEALGWKRKYKQLQIETAERLEKLEPWMVEWLYDRAKHTPTYADVRFCPRSHMEVIAAAIYHAIGEEDAQG